MNLAILKGKLGRDPEVKQNGDFTVVTFPVATDGFSGGEKKTDWHNVKAFSKTADFVDRYFSKGSEIALQGKIVTESWENKEGVKVYRTFIYADRVEFCGPPQGKSEKNTDDVSW